MSDISLRGATFKSQSWLTVLLLSFVTFGIYTWFWYHRINSELKAFGAAYGDQELADSKPGSSVLAITLGAFILIPALISVWNTGKRVERANKLVGRNDYNFGMHVLLMFVTGLWFIYDQSELNSLWEYAAAQEGAGATQATAAA